MATKMMLGEQIDEADLVMIKLAVSAIVLSGLVRRGGVTISDRREDVDDAVEYADLLLVRLGLVPKE